MAITISLIFWVLRLSWHLRFITWLSNVLKYMKTPSNIRFHEKKYLLGWGSNLRKGTKNWVRAWRIGEVEFYQLVSSVGVTLVHITYLSIRGHSITKVCPIENNTNLNSIFWLMKSSKADSIFLPALYLIIQLMTLHKNFEEIAILKILELFSFWGFKTHFGEEKATFIIEILLHGSKSCLLDVLWSPKIIKISSRYNTDYIW